jgi:diacylglycerol kinase
MLQIRAACPNKACTHYAEIHVLNLPVVGGNIEAYPRLICSGCTHVVSTEIINSAVEGIILANPNG